VLSQYTTKLRHQAARQQTRMQTSQNKEMDIFTEQNADIITERVHRVDALLGFFYVFCEADSSLLLRAGLFEKANDLGFFVLPF
jgi:hypothetical protein